MRATSYILALALISGCAALRPDAEKVVDLNAFTQHPAGSPASSLLIRIAYFGENKVDFYVVDARARDLKAATSRGGDRAIAQFLERRAQEKKHDAEIFARIVERFDKTYVSGRVIPDVIDTLRRAQNSTSTGNPSEDCLIASPNGAYAVFSTPDYAPMTLTETATLASIRLTKTNDPMIEAPIAWSADSRFIAFAPAPIYDLHIYDVKQGRTVSIIPCMDERVAAISWSPDGTRVAVLGFNNRKMDINPLALLAAESGHPIFRNDAVLHIYRVGKGNPRSIVLEPKVSETSTPNVRLDWGE